MKTYARTWFLNSVPKSVIISFGGPWLRSRLSTIAVATVFDSLLGSGTDIRYLEKLQTIVNKYRFQRPHRIHQQLLEWLIWCVGESKLFPSMWSRFVDAAGRASFHMVTFILCHSLPIVPWSTLFVCPFYSGVTSGEGIRVELLKKTLFINSWPYFDNRSHYPNEQRFKIFVCQCLELVKW